MSMLNFAVRSQFMHKNSYLHPMSTGRRTSPRHASVASQSHDSDEDMGMPATPGSAKESRPLSRNAQAQARLRARRKAYVESLEANVKRLQTIVDAIALNPNRAPHTPSSGSSPTQPPLGPGSREIPSISLPPFISPPDTSSSESIASSSLQPEAIVHHLQADNSRLRRERDALQVQVDALTSYISRGYTLPPNMTPGEGTPSSQGGARMAQPGVEQGFSPSTGSDAETESPSLTHDSLGRSPLIPKDAYTQEDINNLLGLGDPNLAFLRYLQNTPSYTTSGALPEHFASASSAQAAFQSLANSTTPGTNIMSDLPRDAAPNIGFGNTER